MDGFVIIECLSVRVNYQSNTQSKNFVIELTTSVVNFAGINLRAVDAACRRAISSRSVGTCPSGGGVPG